LRPAAAQEEAIRTAIGVSVADPLSLMRRRAI
jgi:hypothetical protein